MRKRGGITSAALNGISGVLARGRQREMEGQRARQYGANTETEVVYFEHGGNHA